MSITQTVDIPASRRLTIDVPREVPVGRTILAFTPVADRGSESVLKNADEEISPHPHSDALFAIFSQIGGNIDIDELRTERLAKHLK